MTSPEAASAAATTETMMDAILGGQRDAVVFDGYCVMCSSLARFIARFDRRGRFGFVTAQSPLGDALYSRLGLRTDVYETNITFVGGRPHLHSDSLLAVLGALGWPWRAARLLLLVPKGLRDRVYRLVADNRYRLFGRKDSCDIPSPAVRERLLD